MLPSSSFLYHGPWLRWSSPPQERQPTKTHTYQDLYLHICVLQYQGCASGASLRLIIRSISGLLHTLHRTTWLLLHCIFWQQHELPWCVEREYRKCKTCSRLQTHRLCFITSRLNIRLTGSSSRAPHFRVLWEAGVKSMKTLLNEIVGPHHRYFEELSTILVGIKATMNSRPLLPADSTPADGSTVLTPVHFLIGQPLRSPPLPVDTTSSLPGLTRWNLIQRLKTEFWWHWSREYLKSCQCWAKGKTPSEDLQRGDIVLKERTDSIWPMARILRTSPGPDAHTHVVETLCTGRAYTRQIMKLVILVPVERGPSPPPPEDVQAGDSTA